MSGIIQVLVLVVVAVGCGWLCSRAWHLRDTGLRIAVGPGLFPTAEQPHITRPQVAPPLGSPAFFRTGVDPENMLWKDIGAANTDDELRAMYIYLHGLT